MPVVRRSGGDLARSPALARVPAAGRVRREGLSDDDPAKVVQQGLEKLESFRLVFLQQVPLGATAEADDGNADGRG